LPAFLIFKKEMLLAKKISLKIIRSITIKKANKMAKFSFQNHIFSPEELIYYKAKNEFEEKIKIFAAEWLSDKEIFEMQTSGSTGVPKKMQFTRQELTESAKATLQFFKIQAGENLLLCLNPDFVAGKMMLVRALVGDCVLICLPPSDNPFRNFRLQSEISLAAFVPLQMAAILEECRENELNLLKNIILGGAPVSSVLETKIKKMSTQVYQTFGMTETLTHFALRALNGSNHESFYRVLPHAEVSLYKGNLLKINIFGKEILTNDMAEILAENAFRWLGRADFVINSGGYKIFAEKNEALLAEFLAKKSIKNVFVFLGIPDEKLGEKCVLVFENLKDCDSVGFVNFMQNNFYQYEVPKKIYSVDIFPRTGSGKIDRNALKKLVNVYREL
jgi:O-succinylbenzoic acid--CoA ligase